MTLPWLFSVAALAVALFALREARRTADRLREVSQMYWELKFQHAELRRRLEESGSGTPEAPRAPAVPPVAAGGAFIPLASVRR